MELKEFAKAEKIFAKQIKRGDAYVTPYVFMGDICEKTNRKEDALQWYLTAVERMKASGDGGYHLESHIGTIYFERGDYAQAAHWYREAVKEQPENSQHYYNLGISHMRSDDVEGAEIALRMCVQANKNFADAWFALGIIAKSRGESKEAINCFEKTIALKPDDSRPHFQLGYVYNLLGDYEVAAEHAMKYEKLKAKEDKAEAKAKRSKK